jgi:hypothetical protein
MKAKPMHALLTSAFISASAQRIGQIAKVIGVKE